MNDIIINQDPGDEQESVSSSVCFTKPDGTQVHVDADMIDLLEDENSTQQYAIVEVSQSDYEEGNIRCPHTNSNDIYRISNDIYASFETDQPFMVKIV